MTSNHGYGIAVVATMFVGVQASDPQRVQRKLLSTTSCDSGSVRIWQLDRDVVSVLGADMKISLDIGLLNIADMAVVTPSVQHGNHQQLVDMSSHGKPWQAMKLQANQCPRHGTPYICTGSKMIQSQGVSPTAKPTIQLEKPERFMNAAGTRH